MKKNQGFLALTEKAIVLSVLGILMMMAIPTYRAVQERGRNTRAISDIGNIIAIGCEQYKLDVGVYPISASRLLFNIDASPKWKGPYVNLSPLNDPWKMPYYLQAPTGITVLIHSRGRDKLTDCLNANSFDRNRATHSSSCCVAAPCDDLGLYLD